MGFFDSLAANPTGSGIYGNTGAKSPDFGTALSIDEEMRRRNKNDMMQNANFMSNLQVRQNRMNSIYGTNPMAPGMGQPGGPTGMVTGLNNPQMQTVFKEDPDRITPIQRERLNISREDLANDRAKIGVTSRLGEERLKDADAKHDLDVKKNQNIFDTKQADLQRKHDEAQQKLELAQRQFEQRSGDANAKNDFLKAKMEADAARHQLESAQKDRTLEETKRLHDAQIAKMQEQSDQAGNTEQTTELNPEGTKRTVSTKRGSGGSKNDPAGIRK